jgi:hypothetical protein
MAITSVCTPLKRRLYLTVVMMFVAGASSAARFGLTGGMGYVSADKSDLDRDAEYWASPESADVSSQSFGWEIGGLGELPLDETLSAGFFAGYTGAGSAESQAQVIDDSDPLLPLTISQRVQTSASSIPMTLYLKYQPQKRPFAFWAGAGADYLRVRSHFNFAVLIPGSGYEIDGEFEKNKMAPHLAVGSEYFFTPRISIALNLRYLFNAKVEGLKGQTTTTTTSGSFSMKNSEEAQLIMVSQDGGEFLSIANTDTPLAGNERPYQVNLNGIRALISLRVYFGGSNEPSPPAL